MMYAPNTLLYGLNTDGSFFCLRLTTSLTLLAMATVGKSGEPVGPLKRKIYRNRIDSGCFSFWRTTSYMIQYVSSASVEKCWLEALQAMGWGFLWQHSSVAWTTCPPWQRMRKVFGASWWIYMPSSRAARSACIGFWAAKMWSLI